jgi:hypothetical protein
MLWCSQFTGEQQEILYFIQNPAKNQQVIPIKN